MRLTWTRATLRRLLLLLEGFFFCFHKLYLFNPCLRSFCYGLNLEILTSLLEVLSTIHDIPLGIHDLNLEFLSLMMHSCSS